MVDVIPWDHHFKLQCNADNCIEQQKDGRWYKMNSTTRKGLNGTMKVGSCKGSRICHDVDCPKLQFEGICNINPKDFTFENGAYICRSCGYYAVQIFCGCRKVTFNLAKQFLPHYHKVHPESILSRERCHRFTIQCNKAATQFACST